MQSSELPLLLRPHREAPEHCGKGPRVWDINTQKFPRGEEDVRDFTAQIRGAGLRPRLWWAPLAADPDSNLFQERPDMLLLDVNSAKQRVTWWDEKHS